MLASGNRGEAAQVRFFNVNRRRPRASGSGGEWPVATVLNLLYILLFPPVGAFNSLPFLYFPT